MYLDLIFQVICGDFLDKKNNETNIKNKNN